MNNNLRLQLSSVDPVKFLSYNVRFQSKNVSKDVCLFSSYSFSGIVEDYVFHYLEKLKEAGFDIVFVSTSRIENNCLDRLKGYCFLVVERENKCPDFGSWKVGLSLLNWGQDFNSILLANDSVFGPFFDLQGIIKKMTLKYDMWGMTDSYEIDYHLQSYFLFFNRNILLSKVWHSFWQNVDLTLSKQEVIAQYEIGLSKIFQNAKFRLGAYASVEVVHKSARHDHKYINTSLGFWKILVEQYDFPFLKREILIKPDIHRVYWERGLYINIRNWRNLFTTKLDYPIKYIDTFLDKYHQLAKKSNKDLVARPGKILFLSHNVEIGGAQRVLLNFISWFKQNTDIPFEIIICRCGETSLLDEFSRLGNVTFFYNLSDYEKQRLKNRLVDEQIALIFSNTMVNIEVQQFLSFLDVPQIIFVHELTHVLRAFPSITDNIDWTRSNISHFVACAHVVKDNLINFLKIEEERVTVVHEFINHENRISAQQVDEIRKNEKIPRDAFVVGMSGTFEWRKSADLIPVIANTICSEHKDIHLVWLGADTKNNSLYERVISDIEKAGLLEKVHLIEKKNQSSPFFKLFDIFLMISREDPFPLVNLESGAAGKPVICFKNSGGSEEYVSLGTGSAVPYMDIKSLSEKVLEYYESKLSLPGISDEITSIVKHNFTTEIQAPKLLQVIRKYYDERERVLVEQPSITFMVHIFFDTTWEEIKTQLRHFDNGTNYFLFSISEACLVKDTIAEDIRKSFRNSYTVISSNIGRDIGSKMVLIDMYLTLKINSTYIVFLHDKQSPHTLVGESWKKNLFKVIDPCNHRTILATFQSDKVGIVGAKEHFINEYDTQTGLFRHNNDLSKQFLKLYNISINNYEYISGTIYWIKASIIEKFFSENNPIVLRKQLESGNILDNKRGTQVHTWERMFCWMTTNYGYSIKGI